VITSLFLLIVVVAGVVSVARLRTNRAADQGGPGGAFSVDLTKPVTDTTAVAPNVETPVALQGALERWVGASLLTPEQSSAIVRYEQQHVLVAPAAAAPSARRVPAIAEALGYLGGILAVVGLIMFVAHYWPTTSTLWKLVLSGGVAAALWLGGWAVPEAKDDALARLRGFVWLMSMAAGTLFAGVAVYNGWGITRHQSVLLACTATASVMGALMWRGRTRPLQQAATLVALVIATGALVSEFTSTGPAGLMVWAVGATILASGQWQPMTTKSLNFAVGSAALVAGGVITSETWLGFGLLFSTVTAMALLALVLTPKVRFDRVKLWILGAVGVVAVDITVPRTIAHFANQAGVATGVIVWTIGVALLTLGAERRIRFVGLVEVVGGVALIGGAAECATESQGFATIFGLFTALALIALGTRPGQIVLSFLGSAALLINVPWSIAHFFPGPGRAPLLILISGALILALAVLLAHERRRAPTEFGALINHHWPTKHGRVSH
jgi:hypothetical protein